MIGQFLTFALLCSIYQGRIIYSTCITHTPLIHKFVQSCKIPQMQTE